jgi:hypothetical protein
MSNLYYLLTVYFIKLRMFHNDHKMMVRILSYEMIKNTLKMCNQLLVLTFIQENISFTS